MAESIGLHPSQFDFNDKNELIKRIKRENEGLLVDFLFTKLFIESVLKQRQKYHHGDQKFYSIIMKVLV